MIIIDKQFIHSTLYRILKWIRRNSYWTRMKKETQKTKDGIIPLILLFYVSSFLNFKLIVKMKVKKIHFIL